MVRIILSLMISTFLMASGLYADGPAIGEAAPGFTLNDTEDNSYSLADLEGKVVVLEWTNPNCPFVVRHYRDDLMPALQRQYAEEGVVWFAINSTHPEHRDFETDESLNDIFTEWNAAYRGQLVDLDGSVGRAYSAQTTPQMYIIDENGVLRYNGAIDDDPRGNQPHVERVQYFQNALEQVLNGETVEVSTTRPYGCTVKYTKDT